MIATAKRLYQYIKQHFTKKQLALLATLCLVPGGSLIVLYVFYKKYKDKIDAYLRSKEKKD